jgi:hypothetical protein
MRNTRTTNDPMEGGGRLRRPQPSIGSLPAHPAWPWMRLGASLALGEEAGNRSGNTPCRRRFYTNRATVFSMITMTGTG